jgi:iron(II)-dependent oxidoreductase
MRAVELCLALALLAPPAPAPAATPMIDIPAGTFRMGSDSGPDDERPAHEVMLIAFSIDRTPVTNADFAEFLDAHGPRGAKGERYFDDDDPDARIHRAQGRWRADSPYEDHPVIEVSWRGAREYCARLGKRLPTEVEWEKAARGTDGRLFPWGDTFDASKSNSPQRGLGRLMPVGSFPQGRSPYGLSDVSGNVWEWTESWYLPYPGNTHGSVNYGEQYKVVRGGSYVDCSFYRCGLSAPTFNRGFFKRETKNSGFGFRCAK